MRSLSLGVQEWGLKLEMRSGGAGVCSLMSEIRVGGMLSKVQVLSFGG